jgi:hypothetical protein
LLGELADVVSEGLTMLLLAALEIPRVFRAHVRPVEVADEHLLELCPATDAVGWQKFKQEILDDEKSSFAPPP